MSLQTILGANGTIGKVLARELVQYTSQIRLVSRNPRRVNEGDELFPADLTDPGQVDGAVRGSEIVYLVVGFEYKLSVWQKFWPALMEATIAACIKYHAKLVFFDNIYLYDIKAIGWMTEESAINAPSKKGKLRQRISAMITDQVQSGRLTALIARAPDFYGPDNNNSILNEGVYKNLLKDKRANWFCDANKKHSFIYTPDGAKATAILGNTPDAYNQVWHLPTDPATLTGNELIALFNGCMHRNKKPMVLSLFMIRLVGLFIPLLREFPEMMYQFDRDYFFDSTKFKKRFGFVPTTYREGIEAIVSNG